MQRIASVVRLQPDKEVEHRTPQRWWELTDPCRQPVESVSEGEWWAPAEEVFHLD